MLYCRDFKEYEGWGYISPIMEVAMRRGRHNHLETGVIQWCIALRLEGLGLRIQLLRIGVEGSEFRGSEL